MEENETTTKKKLDFPQTYIRFRTVLDCMDTTAMRYFLKDSNKAKRIERAEELERKLMPIIREYENMMMGGEGPGQCPEGFVRCKGCCMPYPCP